jgi:hypothetical protein
MAIEPAIFAFNSTICLTLCDYVVWFLCHVVLWVKRVQFLAAARSPEALSVKRT